MGTIQARFAAAAAALIGTRFRLRGRDPRTGLDCVGLASIALERAGRPHRTPAGYGLRNLCHEAFLPFIEQAGFGRTSGAIMGGDLFLARPGPGQFHVLVASTPKSFVHAHAGLGRVVETPGPPEWPLLGHWRLLSN